MGRKFLFLTKEELKDKSKNRIQSILENEAIKAKQSEVLIGIDPQTYLGSEILKQSREIIQLRHDVYELRMMTTDLISRLEDKIDPIE